LYRPVEYFTNKGAIPLEKHDRVTTTCALEEESPAARGEEASDNLYEEKNYTTPE
jgi:hypothetical protein